MLLKSNDTGDFALTMNLRIDWELRYIEVTVCLWNKKKHTMTTKTFPAEKFYAAVEYFDQQEKMFL